MSALTLASASPRRLELLAQLGVRPDAVLSAEIDETPHAREAARALALRLAIAKAHEIRRQRPRDIVLAADTVVAVGLRILPKALTREEAAGCLELLSGRRHRVIGGIAVIAADGRQATRVVTSIVRFKRLAPDEIAAYLDSGEWRGKAGGYAIQGRAAALIPWIAGSYSNIVGLALAETAALLSGADYRW